MAFKFLGTTLTAPGTTTELRSISFDEAGDEIDVTNAGDTLKVYEIGLNDLTCTAEYNGRFDGDVGDTGAVTATWNNGSTQTMTVGVVSSISITGDLSSSIVSTVVYKNTQA